MNIDRISPGSCYLYRPARRYRPRHPQRVRVVDVHRAAGRVSVVALPGGHTLTVAAHALRPEPLARPDPVTPRRPADER